MLQAASPYFNFNAMCFLAHRICMGSRLRTRLHGCCHYENIHTEHCVT